MFPCSDPSAFDNVISSPESTAKTADSGIESLAKRLCEDTQLGSSEGSSPLPPTTGNEQVDHALIYHLVYCERLLEVCCYVYRCDIHVDDCSGLWEITLVCKLPFFGR